MDRKDLYAFVMYSIDFEDYSDVSNDFCTPLWCFYWQWCIWSFVMFLGFSVETLKTLPIFSDVYSLWHWRPFQCWRVMVYTVALNVGISIEVEDRKVGWRLCLPALKQCQYKEKYTKVSSNSRIDFKVNRYITKVCKSQGIHWIRLRFWNSLQSQ